MMLRKIVLGGVAAACVAVAGMGAVSQPAEAGVRVHIGIPGIFGYWGPRYYYAPYYYPPYPAYYYGGPYYNGYYARPYAYTRPYRSDHCKVTTGYRKIYIEGQGTVRKKVTTRTCW